MSVVCDLVIAALYYLFFMSACWRLYVSVGGFDDKASMKLAFAWPITLPVLALVAAGQIIYDMKKKEN